MAILDNIRNVMNKVIRIVCILLFAFMVIIGTYQILVRYIFNSHLKCIKIRACIFTEIKIHT